MSASYTKGRCVVVVFVFAVVVVFVVVVVVVVVIDDDDDDVCVYCCCCLFVCFCCYKQGQLTSKSKHSMGLKGQFMKALTSCSAPSDVSGLKASCNGE